ncbi:hypothetical protein L208DRAFT_1239079 [Tricholoma matsutake]|nr:hypothetical protein L208DRAFT_1239079 [Tricholoma matsutake 945]
MDLGQWLDNVFTSLEQNRFTIPTLIQSVLESSSSYHHDSLLFGAPSICSDLLAYSQTGAIFLWAFETVKGKLCQELVALMDSDSGLHFNASKTSSDYLKGSFMQIAAQKIKHSAPYLWDLVYSMLDANPSCRHAMVHNLNDAEVMEGLAAVEEGDLGKIGGDNEMDMMEDKEDIGDADKPEVKAKKRRIRAASWNAALLVIVSCSFACVPPCLVYLEICCFHQHFCTEHK